MADPDFRRGALDIQFLDRRPDLVSGPPTRELVERLAVAAALAEDERRRTQKPVVSNGAGSAGGWLLSARRDPLR